ncbi:MAG: AAA family ATPase, partial [Candidatus Heimdallarchaeota archaeon]
MRNLHISPGDIVELCNGDKITGAIAWLSEKDNISEEFVRIDGIIRRNIGLKLNESVTLKRANVEIGETVKIIAYDDVLIDSTLKQYVKQKLLGFPISHNDLLVIQLLGHANKFIIDTIIPDSKLISVITDTSKIIFVDKPIKIVESDFQINYEDIGGLRDTIKKIREMIELPLRHPELFKKLGISPPKGLLLHGPPGTGKTLIAKAVANESEANFVSIQGPEIMSKFYGESEAKLREIFKKAENAAPSIIFIDEIDAISSKRDETLGEVERRVVAQILSLMDGLESRGQVIVIGATNRLNALDPALRRPGRFDREILISVPDQLERLEILQIHTRRMPGIEKVDLVNLSRLTNGFVGADLASLARESAMNIIKDILPMFEIEKMSENQDFYGKLEVTEDHFLLALKDIQPSAAREISTDATSIDWESIGGLSNIKNELFEIIDWPINSKTELIRLDIKPYKGILLYGPSGTGKTQLVKAVANKTNVSLISIKGPELLSKWVGESEKALREIFKKAKMLQNCIIFFDEIDSFSKSRNSQNSETSSNLLSQLLTELDSIELFQNVIIIAATNRPDFIDNALLRPGRIDKLLYLKPPNEEERIEIFNIHLSKKPLAEDVAVENLAKITVNFTGADIFS